MFIYNIYFTENEEEITNRTYIGSTYLFILFILQRMKKKLQIGLISGPLGDVRHTAHVGHSDGDVFGDTTFLQVTVCLCIIIYNIINTSLFLCTF